MAKNTVKNVVTEGENVGADAQEVLASQAESSTEKEPVSKVTKEVINEAPKVKLVKIHTTEEVDCYISNIPYKFKKDKNVEVPSDVAAILVNAQKAYRQ